LVSLHVEATSRCTLACPRCERTELLSRFGKKALPITDLDVSDFKTFIDIDIDNIVFCGNLGDPIYHANFLELVKESKLVAKSIIITTNGSRKSKSWWKKLNAILDDKDKITFSIDGTPDNFTQYRINGDWPSVRVGIDECVLGPAKVVWKYIPFKFNENDIESTRLLSNKLGIDEFKVEPSDRWNEKDESIDTLRPTLESLVGARDIVQRDFETTPNRDFVIDPKCKNNRHHFISSDGYYSPCCYSKHYNFYYKSQWRKNKEDHNIKTSKLSNQISMFNSFYATIQTSRPDYCLFNCGTAVSKQIQEVLNE